MLAHANAPTVFISYTHDTPEHEARVLELADRLRSEGVDAKIDRYEESPSEGWPRWMMHQIAQADFVLAVCTETYKRRFEGHEAPGRGLGGIWEGAVLTQQLYEDQAINTKFVPIVFHAEDVSNIPLTLRGTTHYRLDTENGYELLYRRLTGQPLVPRPELGERRVLPALRRRQSRPVELWNVPHPRNPFFTGREAALEQIKGAFAFGAASPRPHALSGLAGSGKTQLAAEFSHCYRHGYGAVLWARADAHEELVTSFVEIARLLDLPAKDLDDQNAVVGAVKGWLAGNDGWLLVFDNASDLAKVEREFLPQRFSGHVLFTTQIRATGAMAVRVDVDELEPEEGALLLLRRAKVIEEGAPLGDAPAGHRTAARTISEELGGLPLALDQAGAFIEEGPSTPEEYLNLYRAEGEKLRDERGGVPLGPSGVRYRHLFSFLRRDR